MVCIANLDSQSIFTVVEAERVWLISDTHFGHKNILRYCKRPFPNTAVMNSMLVDNWCRTVSDSDLVYFLGDLAMCQPISWIEKLSGKKVWVRGSHDKDIDPTSDIYGVLRVVDSEIISCNGLEFLLIHDVRDADVTWKDWIIRGHIHDNRPFIDPKHYLINVSLEAIGYKPVSLAQVIRIINSLG